MKGKHLSFQSILNEEGGIHLGLWKKKGYSWLQDMAFKSFSVIAWGQLCFEKHKAKEIDA